MPAPGGAPSSVLGPRWRVDALGERGEGLRGSPAPCGTASAGGDSPSGEELPVPSEEGMKSPVSTSIPQPIWSELSQETPGLCLAVVLYPQPRAAQPA